MDAQMEGVDGVGCATKPTSHGIRPLRPRPADACGLSARRIMSPSRSGKTTDTRRPHAQGKHCGERSEPQKFFSTSERHFRVEWRV